jgi:hypothetical protein
MKVYVTVRPALLVVPGLGADAKDTGPACAATGRKGRRVDGVIGVFDIGLDGGHRRSLARAKRPLVRPPRTGLCRIERALAFMRRQAYAQRMFIQNERTDFSVAIKRRGKPPNPWRWEIYRAGRSSAIAQSSELFPTMGAANKAGKEALAELIKKLHIRAFG